METQSEVGRRGGFVNAPSGLCLGTRRRRNPTRKLEVYPCNDSRPMGLRGDFEHWNSYRLTARPWQQVTITPQRLSGAAVRGWSPP
jgi:hypothetical protein